MFHRRSGSKHALYTNCIDIKLNSTFLDAVCPLLTVRGTLLNCLNACLPLPICYTSFIVIFLANAFPN